MYAKNKYTHAFALSAYQEIMVPKGAGLNKTAQILADAQVIDNPWWFILFARVLALQNSLKAGEYAFEAVSYTHLRAHET